MKQILGIGNALVDVMTQIDDDHILVKFSLPKGSMTLVDNEKSQAVKAGTMNFKRNLASGGSAANTIHGLAMLKANAGFIGSIGRDETGDFFENDMKKAGVKTMLFRRSTMTGTAVALISPDSERTFATHLGAAVELGADDLKPELFKSFDILYLEGYLINDKSLVEKACRIARENNMEVVLDLASYNVVLAKIDDFRDIVSKYVDIIFANEEEAIILEDDCLPHPTFFRFCEELLERYRDDERVTMISGDNFQFGKQRTPYSYYFSRYVHVWGWASWRRAWQNYNVNIELWPEIKEGNWLQDLLGNRKAVRYWTKGFDQVFQL